MVWQPVDCPTRTPPGSLYQSRGAQPCPTTDGMRELPTDIFALLSNVNPAPARRPGGGPGPERNHHDKDCSKSKSWSKSRGHKSHGKGRKHGKKDC